MTARKRTSLMTWLLCLAASCMFVYPAVAGRTCAWGRFSKPTLSRIAPAQIDAGSPAFTLTVYGSGFRTDSTVRWTADSRTTALSTAFVSSTELRATVPSSLVANPGRADITVHTPSAGTSTSKTFTILVTSLQWNIVMSYNSDGEYTALLHIKNSGYRTAENLTLTRSTLASAATTRSLPMSLGNLAPGDTLLTDLTYPASAGDAGDVVALNIAGFFTGDTFDEVKRVSLP